MTRRFVDLSMTLENEIVSDPPFLKPHIEYEVHDDTRKELEFFFSGVDYGGMIGGDVGFCAAERVTLTTHSGTHVDAPWHYHPQQDSKSGNSRPAMTIDEMPLEWFFQRGVKLDFRHMPRRLCRDRRRYGSRTEAHRP
jgi:kynurenine formamidase